MECPVSLLNKHILQAQTIEGIATYSEDQKGNQWSKKAKFRISQMCKNNRYGEERNNSLRVSQIIPFSPACYSIVFRRPIGYITFVQNLSEE